MLEYTQRPRRPNKRQTPHKSPDAGAASLCRSPLARPRLSPYPARRDRVLEWVLRAHRHALWRMHMVESFPVAGSLDACARCRTRRRSWQRRRAAIDGRLYRYLGSNRSVTLLGGRHRAASRCVEDAVSHSHRSTRTCDTFPGDAAINSISGQRIRHANGTGARRQIGSAIRWPHRRPLLLASWPCRVTRRHAYHARPALFALPFSCHQRMPAQAASASRRSLPDRPLSVPQSPLLAAKPDSRGHIPSSCGR